MKKTLLTLASMLCMAITAAASDATVSFADKYPAGAPVEYVQANECVLLRFTKGTSNSVPTYDQSKKAIHIYKNNTLTVTGAEGVTISKIEFTFTDANYAGLGIDGSDAVIITDATGVWEGSSASVEFTASKVSYLTDIKVTYSGTGTIAPPSVADISEFLSTKPSETTAIKSDAVAVYQAASSNYSWLFIKDNSGWLCVTGNVRQTYNPGDIVPGNYQGTLEMYGGSTPQLNNPKNFSASTSTAAVIEPTATTPAELSSCPVNSYVTISGATIAAVDGSETDFTCTVSGTSATLSNKFDTYISLGDNRTIKGFVILDSEKYIICPTSVTDADGKEYVKTPTISPTADEIWKGDKITLSCATSGASIYYTINGSEPTTGSTLYSEPFPLESDATVKAIAILDGMANSAVSSATYTVKTLPANVALFNFNDPASIMTAPSYGQQPTAQFAGMTDDMTLGDNVIVSGEISITAPATAKMYQGNSKVEFRPGKGAVMTITANGNKIKTVTFTGTKFNNLTTTSEGSYDQTTGIYTAPDGGLESVVFKTPSSGFSQATISTISVECANDMQTAITTIDADTPDAAAEYYNLQGIRVNEPTNGLYIRRQGKKVEKVIIR